MRKQRQFVFSTRAGSRLPVWLRIWLTLSVVAAGVILLWFGLVLALVVVLAAMFALVPLWLWRSLVAKRNPGGPATIEGEYTVGTTRVIEGEVTSRSPRGDAERPPH